MSITEFLETIFFLLTSFFKAFCRTCLPSYMQSRKKLNGQVVLITGAGSGIGQELAKHFARKETKLVLWDLSANSNENTAELCRSIGAKEVYTQTVDLSSREAIYFAANQIEKITNGKIKIDYVEIVVNNAGIRNNTELYQEASDESVEQVIRVNLMQTLWTTKIFLPYMIARNSGHIVAVSSVGAFVGLPTAPDYTASKFGVFGFMEAIQSDLHWQNPKTNIHFTTICPHFVATPLIQQSTLSQKFPHLTPEEVAKSVVDGVERNQRVVFIPSAPLTVMYALKGILPWNVFNYLALKKMQTYS